ncbi:tetratricopeptide repeat protein [Chitinibacter bivalviorum]|uniref:Tetratricopeptide repeat protein n=1 Tax=Chitinibacter bivalviorum TaxID=2739434 RepID=A0A7H9BL97_9NEIS|nr:tetratricopeptide repeat protein [Chitinibacter bivalviorum]QLG89116.1 tetratricopeptide repeat protein [Chitinibacter bivalviorum]
MSTECLFSEQYAAALALLTQNTEQAQAQATQLVAIARQQQDGEWIGQAYRLQAKAQSLAGQKKDAIKTLQTAIRYLKRLKHMPPVMQCEDELGQLYYEQLDYYLALDSWLKSLEIAALLQDSRGCIRAYIGVGKVHFAFGDFRKAMHFHLIANSLSLPLQDKELDCEVALNIATAAYRLGELDRALAALGQVSQHLLDGINHPEWRAEVLTYDGLIHLHFERYREAQEILSQAYQLFRHNKLVAGQVQVMSALARCFIGLNQIDLAEECLQEAVRLSERQQLATLLLESQSLLAELYLDSGQYKLALEHRKKLHDLLTGQSLGQGFPLKLSRHSSARLRKIERELEMSKSRHRLLRLMTP